MVVVLAAVLFPSSSSRTLALAPARRADHSTLAIAVEFRHAERTFVINAPALVVVVVGATEPVQDEGGVEVVVVVIILEVTSLVGFYDWVRRRRREEEEGGRRAVAVGCRDVVAGWRGGEGGSLRSRGF